MLRDVCGAEVDAALLKATELRLAGNAAARAGDLRQAFNLYTVGLELQVCRLPCAAAGRCPPLSFPAARRWLRAAAAGCAATVCAPASLPTSAWLPAPARRAAGALGPAPAAVQPQRGAAGAGGCRGGAGGRGCCRSVRPADLHHRRHPPGAGRPAGVWQGVEAAGGIICCRQPCRRPSRCPPLCKRLLAGPPPSAPPR